MGYYRAGFEVVGVDINPQPRYPFEFHQADALEYVAEHSHEFNAIHASPPCQAFCALKRMPNAKEHPNLIPQTRQALQGTGRPYVIENVPGSAGDALRNDVRTANGMRSAVETASSV
jgi:DNA (cytosine-5)-methyltransferase 1